jgi:Protein of unknown function (DUF551)
MEWISIKDHLPDKKQEVICFDGKEVFSGVEYSEKYGFEWMDYGYSPINITHWMPLPKAPL